jgi:hypothetical protein
MQHVVIGSEGRLGWIWFGCLWGWKNAFPIAILFPFAEPGFDEAV